MATQKEIAKIPEKDTSITSLKLMIKIETERRKLLNKYISDNLEDGVDYGRIHIAKNCTFKYDLKNCKTDGHWSKKSLFKPGSEKFCSLMHLRPTFKKDVDTYEMAGSLPGLFCYICELVDQKGNIVGEGRGAASISEKQWTPNNAIKISEKRAQIDAILRTGTLSDQFTQDMEDMKNKEEVGTAQISTPGAATNADHSYGNKVTEKQVKFIFVLLSQKGKDKEKIYEHMKIKDMNDLSYQDARIIIDKLIKLPNVVKTNKPVDSPEVKKKVIGEEEEDFIKGLEKDKEEAENKEKEVKKPDPVKSPPALNFELGWVRAHWSDLAKLGLVMEGQKDMIDYMSKQEVIDLKEKYMTKKGGEIKNG